MRRLIRFFLYAAILIAASLSIGYAEDTFCSGPWLYRILENGTAEIVLFIGEETQIEVPAEIDGIRVSSIGWNAFYPDHWAIIDPDPRYYREFLDYMNSPRGVESITIPEGVTTIRDGAFANCTGLQTVALPNSVNDLGANPFDCCFVLSTIQVSPDHPSFEVRDGVLFNKQEECLLCYPLGLTADCYNIPEGTRSIGDYAFAGTSLSSIVIPDTVVSIGNYAFQNTALTSVQIPGSVTNFGVSVFQYCDNLIFCDLPENMTYIADNMFYGCRRLSSITIPDGVISIGEFAFGNCSDLNVIELPGSVNTIGESAFIRCKGLTSFRIPEGVTAIQDHTFMDCENLTEVIISDSVKSIDFCALRGCRGLTRFDIPESVISLGDLAFFECDHLETVSISANLRTVGYNPFEDCFSLTSIRVPDKHPTLSVMDGVLFSKPDRRLICFPCGLEKDVYEIPHGTQIIGERAFEGCQRLKSVTIPDSVTTIEDLAFYKCNQLTLFVFRDSYAAVYCEENHLRYIVLD